MDKKFNEEIKGFLFTSISFSINFSEKNESAEEDIRSLSCRWRLEKDHRFLFLRLLLVGYLRAYCIPSKNISCSHYSRITLIHRFSSRLSSQFDHLLYFEKNLLDTFFWQFPVRLKFSIKFF